MNYLKELRDKSGITQQEMAKRSGISRVHLINIEKARVTPSVKLALQMAEILGTTVESIFKEQ